MIFASIGGDRAFAETGGCKAEYHKKGVMLHRRLITGTRFAALFLLSLLLISCAAPRAVKKPPIRIEKPSVKNAPRLEKAPVVRVLLLAASMRARISISEKFFIAGGLDDQSIERIDRGGRFVLKYSAGTVEMRSAGKPFYRAPRIFVRPYTDGKVYLNGKPYRGSFLFEAVDNGIVAINVIEIDDYLKGVLPSEIGYLSGNQYEAYRAQAIASRSYALSKIEEKRGELYDLKSSIMDQVYKGVLGENAEASRAVDETRGVIAVWDGKPIKAYYSSCCGGHTSDIRLVWPRKPAFPYLYGVRDTVAETMDRSLCSRSHNFRWSVTWSGTKLSGILRKTIPAELNVAERLVGRLKDINVLKVGTDGRVAELEISTDRGSFRVQGDKIRWVLRPVGASGAILKSTMFKLNVRKARGRVLSVNLRGGGNGHGVGMCQSGAIRMAELGYSGEEIIRHYYPGVHVEKIYN